MKLKQTTLATALTAALAMGVSGQAAAYVYGGSALEIDNFSVVLSGVGPGTSITSFQFTTTNTATLNGVSAAPQSESCGGTPGAPGVGTNNCNGATPRLDALAANAPGSAPIRANNDFSLFGPGANQYANADSVIYTAELTLDATSHTQQIAESELQHTGSGNSNAEITSNTGFVMLFTTSGGPGSSLVIDFDADPYLRAAISDPLFLNGNAQGNVNFTMTLTNLDTGDQISWAPQGSANNDCSVDVGLAGVTCTEDNDDEDLNRNISTSANNTNLPFSAAASLSDFGITIDNLIDGNWNLSFNAVTSTSVRLTQVPEPGVLALMGLGLAGLGFMSRRRKG